MAALPTDHGQARTFAHGTPHASGHAHRGAGCRGLSANRVRRLARAALETGAPVGPVVGGKLARPGDSAGRLALAATTIPAGIDDFIQAIGYTFDDMSRPLTITSYAGTTTGSAVRNQLAFTYDGWGNIGAITGDLNWIDPVYDAAGNMTSGPVPGAETTRQHFVYDAWNRLAAVRADSGGSPGSTVATYEYDGLRRRVQRTVDSTTFDSSRVLQERL
jgi:hypothetical protein